MLLTGLMSPEATSSVKKTRRRCTFFALPASPSMVMQGRSSNVEDDCRRRQVGKDLRYLGLPRAGTTTCHELPPLAPEPLPLNSPSELRARQEDLQARPQQVVPPLQAPVTFCSSMSSDHRE